MWKFLGGLLVGLVVAVLGIVVVLFAIGRIFASKPPSVAGNSALVLSFRGDIPETAPVNLGIPFIQQQSAPSVRDVWTSLHQAATDNRIKAVILEPHGVIAGWGRLQEIRADLMEFKHSGKPVYAFLESPGSREYYLASAADKIYLSAGDMLEVKGFLLEAMYFKDALNKIGVQFDVDHIGRFKDAGDIFTRTDMSPETREVLGQILDQLYGDFCSTVGGGRHKSAAEIKTLVDSGPFTADQAKADGLVDVIGYQDQLHSELKSKLGLSELNRVDIRSYYRAAPGRGDRIAFLVGEGDIVQGDSSGSFSSQTQIADEAFAKLIRQVRNDPGIKGVILRIDSPGGDSLASDVLLHELKLLSAAKPTVVSMSDVAASGGYYMAMTGGPIIAYPDTITGSIGVLYARPTVHDLLNKVGIQADLISRGRLADMDAISEPLSDAAKQKLHESLQSTYRLFVSKVASARKKSYTQIDQIAQGRVWMGTQAHQNGLVDELGGLDQAVAAVRQRAHLPPTGETNLVMYPPRRSLLEMLSNSSADNVEEAVAERKIRQSLPALPDPALLKGGLLRLMPYQFTIH